MKCYALSAQLCKAAIGNNVVSLSTVGAPAREHLVAPGAVSSRTPRGRVAGGPSTLAPRAHGPAESGPTASASLFAARRESRIWVRCARGDVRFCRRWLKCRRGSQVTPFLYPSTLCDCAREVFCFSPVDSGFGQWAMGLLPLYTNLEIN